MTPEQISQIEREYGSCDTRLAEVFRLARLGLRVEAAPTVHIGGADGMSAFLIKRGKESLPSMQGKRVALVVLDD